MGRRGRKLRKASVTLLKLGIEVNHKIVAFFQPLCVDGCAVKIVANDVSDIKEIVPFHVVGHRGCEICFAA